MDRKALLALSESALLDLIHPATAADLHALVRLGLVCHCAGDEVCPHTPETLLPWPVQEAIIERLWPDDVKESYTLPPPTCALTREALARVRAERFAAGFSLWNPADLIHASPAILDRLERTAKTLRNGRLRTTKTRAHNASGN